MMIIDTKFKIVFFSPSSRSGFVRTCPSQLTETPASGKSLCNGNTVIAYIARVMTQHIKSLCKGNTVIAHIAHVMVQHIKSLCRGLLENIPRLLAAYTDNGPCTNPVHAYTSHCMAHCNKTIRVMRISTKD